MQKVYTKSLTHSLTDEAYSRKVFPDGRPNKGLSAHLAWKLGGSVGRSFFFSKKIWMQKKYNIINVCVFLSMQSLRIGLILVLKWLYSNMSV